MSLWIVHLAKYFLESKVLLSIWHWEGSEGGGRRWDWLQSCMPTKLLWGCQTETVTCEKCIKLSKPKNWFIAAVISPLLFIPIRRMSGTIFSHKKKMLLKYIQTYLNYFFKLGWELKQKDNWMKSCNTKSKKQTNIFQHSQDEWIIESSGL